MGAVEEEERGLMCWLHLRLWPSGVRGWLAGLGVCQCAAVLFPGDSWLGLGTL